MNCYFSQCQKSNFERVLVSNNFKDFISNLFSFKVEYVTHQACVSPTVQVEESHYVTGKLDVKQLVSLSEKKLRCFTMWDWFFMLLHLWFISRFAFSPLRNVITHSYDVKEKLTYTKLYMLSQNRCLSTEISLIFIKNWTILSARIFIKHIWYF